MILSLIRIHSMFHIHTYFFIIHCNINVLPTSGPSYVLFLYVFQYFSAIVPNFNPVQKSWVMFMHITCFYTCNENDAQGFKKLLLKTQLSENFLQSEVNLLIQHIINNKYLFIFASPCLLNTVILL